VGGRRTRIAALVALTLALAFAGVAAGATAAPGPTRSLTAVDTLEAEVLVRLNAIRRKHGLVPLRSSRPLTAAADAHSKAMGTHGFFAHDSRDGSEFWKRVRRFYGPGRYSTWSVGENLLWSSGTIGAAHALQLWMKSPGHRKNILTARWREIGISALSVAAAPGVYGGRDVVIITTDFCVRS
jgi:uncharacterized protein YkwD